jgi:hypothetical protein
MTPHVLRDNLGVHVDAYHVHVAAQRSLVSHTPLIQSVKQRLVGKNEYGGWGNEGQLPCKLALGLGWGWRKNIGGVSVNGCTGASVGT